MAETPIEITKQAPAPTAPTPAEPWLALRSEVDRLFDRFTGSFGFPTLGFPALRRMIDVVPPFRAPAGFPTMVPAVDVTEEKEAFRISMDLPGLSEGDVDLSLSGRTLVIKGEKKQEQKKSEASWHLTERSYGAFERSFALPDSVDAAKVAASFNNGVLVVTLPKLPAAQTETRKIEVKAAA